MRQGDMEWVEMQLKPLRHEVLATQESVNKSTRLQETILTKLKDMKRDHKANILAVDQACNAARSLLQQANRRAREAKIIVDEEPLDIAPAETNIESVSPARPKVAGNRRVI